MYACAYAQTSGGKEFHKLQNCKNYMGNTRKLASSMAISMQSIRNTSESGRVFASLQQAAPSDKRRQVTLSRHNYAILKKTTARITRAWRCAHLQPCVTRWADAAQQAEAPTPAHSCGILHLDRFPPTISLIY